MFLDGIISQMSKIVSRTDIKSRTGGSNIALLEEKDFPILSYHRIDSNVEFSGVY